MVHVAIQEQKEMVIYSVRKAQIKAQSRAQVKALIFNKASTEVLKKYSTYSNVFSAKKAGKLPENTGINKYAIKLKEGKQPLFGLIYSLGLIELETLKTYIKINLANGFICSFKSPARAPILFDRKPDKNLCFCMDY